MKQLPFVRASSSVILAEIFIVFKMKQFKNFIGADEFSDPWIYQLNGEDEQQLAKVLLVSHNLKHT